MCNIDQHLCLLVSSLPSSCPFPGEILMLLIYLQKYYLQNNCKMAGCPLQKHDVEKKNTFRKCYLAEMSDGSKQERQQLLDNSEFGMQQGVEISASVRICLGEDKEPFSSCG